MLLENGGDPNIPDNCNGSTPVHMVAKLGKFMCTDVLYVGTTHIYFGCKTCKSYCLMQTSTCFQVNLNIIVKCKNIELFVFQDAPFAFLPFKLIYQCP